MIRFTCLVPAKEMADTITATLYDGGKAIDIQTTSIRDYADVLIENKDNNAAYTKASGLVKAMLHYGAYAQQLFQYNTGDPANKDYTSDDKVGTVTAETLESLFKKEKQGLDGFGSLAGATLVLEGETTLRLFFEFEPNVALDNLTFTVNGQSMEYKTSDIYYVVEFVNIAAADLDKEFTVTAKSGDNEFNATCSAMTFCYNALVNSDDVALQNVAKALYLYNCEANSYFE